MKHKSIFFSISLIFSSFCFSAQELPKEVVWQEVEGDNVPIPPQTHPRLYVRSSDLPALKERLKIPQAQQNTLSYEKLSKDRTPAEEAAGYKPRFPLLLRDARRYIAGAVASP